MKLTALAILTLSSTLVFASPQQLQCSLSLPPPSQDLKSLGSDFSRFRIEKPWLRSYENPGSAGWRKIFTQIKPIKLCDKGISFYQVNWICKRSLADGKTSIESGRVYRFEDKKHSSFEYLDNPAWGEELNRYKINTDCKDGFTNVVFRSPAGEDRTLIDIYTGARFSVIDDSNVLSPGSKFLLGSQLDSKSVSILNCQNRSTEKGCVAVWSSPSGKYNEFSIANIQWSKNEVKFEVTGQQTLKAQEGEAYNRYGVVCQNLEHPQCKESVTKVTEDSGYID